MICPKCQSENVRVQVVSNTHLKTKHQGCLWWLFIGWWWLLIKWLVFTIPALIFKLFRPKRYTTTNTTHSQCVCQDCGFHWEV